MAITEQLFLDLSRAQQQIRDLDAQIDTLLRPVQVPVDIDATAAVSELRRDLEQVDATVRLDVDGLAQVDEAADDARRLGDEFSDARREADRVGDEAARINRELEGANTGISGFAIGARRLVGVLAAFEGFRVAFDFLAEGVRDSAALAESLNRVNVLFGSFADEIVRFSQESTAALVLTQREVLDAAGTFGGLANTVGLTRAESADFASTLTDLSADLASFGDTSVDDAILAIGSALRGESEPIRRYNVLLNETAVNAKALELGLASTTGEIDEAAKVQARYALILEQTEVAQGDLLATQDSLGNRLKQARVDFANLRIELGEAVVPALEGLLEASPALIDAMQQLAPALGDAAIAAGELAIVLGPIISLLASAPSAAGSFGAILGDIAQEADGAGGFIAEVGERIVGFTSAMGAAQFISRQFIDAQNDLGDAAESTFQRIAGSDLPDFITNVDDAATEAATGLGLYGDAYVDLIPPIEDATLGTAAFTGELETLARLGDKDVKESIKNLRVELGGLGDDIKQELIPDFQTLSEELTTALSGDSNPFASLEANFAAGASAFDALVDEETGKLTGSLSDFVEELTAQIAAETAFDANLAELGRRGFDSLADVFRERGPETARLLEDALADPAQAAELEAQLDGTATSLANSFLETYGAAFAGGDISQDYIQQLTELADAAQSGTVQNALIAAARDLALLFAANFNPQILIDDFNISLPNDVIAANVGGASSGAALPERADGQVGVAQQVININNARTEDVETSAAQAAQTLSAISGFVE